MTKAGRFNTGLLAIFLAFTTGIAYSENTGLAVTTGEATAITASSAELHGAINPGGGTAGAWFEWGTTSSLGSKSDVQIFPEGTAAITFAQPLRDLKPHTTYYFRAVGYRSATTVPGEIRSFTTTDGPPTTTNLTVTTAEATDVTSSTAMLNGTIEPGSTSTAVWFNWGTTSSLGTRTEAQTFSGSSTVRFSQVLRSLQPHTTYYFRAEAYRPSGGGSSVGEVKSFTTADAPTTSIKVTTKDATDVAGFTAVLNGEVAGGTNTLGAWFEWGTTTSLGTKTDVQVFNEGRNGPFSQQLKNLRPATTYYFRAVVYPAMAGVPNVLGEVKSFKTSAEPTTALTVTTYGASAVSSTSVELRGIINTGGVASTAWFEWGSSTPLKQTGVQSFAGSSVASNYAYSLTNLQPNTTYYFRAVAENSGEKAQGEVKTFTTTRVPPTTPQTISEVESGKIRSGYVIITPDTSSAAPTPTVTFGMISQGSVQSQAGIVPTPMTTDGSMFVEVIPSISRSIGVAIANPSDSVNAITMTLRDEDGSVLGSPAIVSVPGQQQVSKFLNELFGTETIGTGFRGSVRMQSVMAFAAIGLRFSGSVFSTLPIAVTAGVPGVPSRTLIAGTSPNTPLPGTVGGSTALIIPQFAIAGGWATQVALVNNSGSTIAGRLDVFDAAGNPMAVKLNGETKSTFTYSIPAGGTLILAPRDSNGQSPL